MDIFVANISFDSTDNQVKALFESFGTVDSAKIICDKLTNKSRGFGFVKMPDDREARNAIKELDGSMLSGRALSVREAEKRSGPAAGGGGGRQYREDNGNRRNNRY